MNHFELLSAVQIERRILENDLASAFASAFSSSSSADRETTDVRSTPLTLIRMVHVLSGAAGTIVSDGPYPRNS
jgi:hypothetical protein